MTLYKHVVCVGTETVFEVVTNSYSLKLYSVELKGNGGNPWVIKTEPIGHI